MTTAHTRQVWKPTGNERQVPCALCGKADAPVLSEENGYLVRRCSCGLVFVSPQPSAEDLALFYGQYFPEEAGELWGRIMARNFDADAAYVARERPQPGRALDIGAGHGHFLARLKALGWQAEGLDLSADAADSARKAYGIEVRREMFRPGLVAPQTYDFISAWYVLEHVKDPAEFLREAFRALKPGGLFGLRVPNMAFSRLFLFLKKVPGMAALLYAAGIGTDGKSSHFNVLDPPAHLYGYTPATLSALLSRAGFENPVVLPAKSVDFGSLPTRLAKDFLFASTRALCPGSAPAITVFAEKPR